MSGLGSNVRQTALLVVQVALILVFGGFVLALAERYNRRFDLTPQKAFVLSEQSKNIAASLPDPAHVVIFYNGQEAERRRQIADLLDQFAAASDKLSYDLYDLDRTPGLAKRYKISNYYTGVVEFRGDVITLDGVDEVSIVGSLLKLTRGHERMLCFLTGHGEHSPQSVEDRAGYSDVAKALEQEGFAIRGFDTAPAAAVLERCTVVVIAGPTHDLFGDESDRLAAHLEHGGKLFVLVDPGAPPSIVAFVQRFGVRLADDLIVDDRNRLYGADSFMPRVPIFDRETFRKNLDIAAVFPLARSVSPTENAPPNVTISLVALSSPESWARLGDTAPSENNPAFRPNEDFPGPVPVAVMATVAAPAGSEQPAGRMAVFGDSDFPTNMHLNLLGNKDLFMSMVGVLAEDQELVAVRQKGVPKGPLSPIYLTATQGRWVFWISTIIVPSLALLVGTTFAYRRTRRRG